MLFTFDSESLKAMQPNALHDACSPMQAPAAEQS